jgi:hypothetical protein
MIRVTLEAQMPDEEVEAFLQMIRTWDGGREDRRVAIKLLGGDLAVEDLATIFRRLDPPLPVMEVMRREDDVDE